jgi:DNA-binding MarR family transcriptional regulator
MARRHPSEQPRLERYFTYRLNTLSKLNDLASQDMYLAGAGLSLPETRCLAAVGSFPALTVNQLAFEANLDKGQASRAAQALVERGFLTKSDNAVDARSVVLALTREGKQLWKKVMPLIDQRNQHLLECLSEDEQAQLDVLLRRLLDHALQRR